MTDTDLMQLVAGRSPAAAPSAIAALRAIRVDSPVVELRVASVAGDALRDHSVEWSPEEREALAEACARAVGADPIDTAARDRLSALLTASGLSAAELARVLGRDERTMRKWLSGQMVIPGAVASMLARAGIDVHPAHVVITLAR